MAEYRFKESSVFTEYKRTVYNIIDVLAVIGGLFGSLKVIGMSVTKVLSYNLMLSSLIDKLYHFKPRFDGEGKKNNKKSKKKPKKKEIDKFKAGDVADFDEASDDDEMKAAYR